jgi:hypothetical protein
MKKTLLTLGVVLGLTLNCTAVDSAAVGSHNASYHAAGKAVVEMVINKKVDAAEVQKKVDIMTADALWFANEYSAANPSGAKLIKAIIDNLETMKKSSFKEIEHDWHDLHHFDTVTDLGLDIKAEENEHFTDPIHTLVHPLLVLKAAQSYTTSKSEDDLKSMKEEMEEGLEQCQKMASALNKKVASK